MIRLLLALALLLTATPAGAEKLVQTVSRSQVLISSSFEGATLSLFGTIQPDVSGTVPQGPYNVVVVITAVVPVFPTILAARTSEWIEPVR